MDTNNPNELENTASSNMTERQPEIMVNESLNNVELMVSDSTIPLEDTIDLNSGTEFVSAAALKCPPLITATNNSENIPEIIVAAVFPTSFIPFYETENAVYGTIDIEDCFRSPEHSAMFNYKEVDDAIGTIESYTKFGRMKPVFGVLRVFDNKPMCGLIDGNRYVEMAKLNGIRKVFICIITAIEQDEISKIMALLQFSNHNTYMALFRIIQNLWPIYYKGQGYRSDLDDAQFDRELPNADGTRRYNIYQKIGKVMGLSGNAVKFIRKIGIVNPLHFKQIETTRHSLYAAYLTCKNEVAGIEPVPPKPKLPTFIRTSTNNLPEFSEPVSTTNASPEVNLPTNSTRIPAVDSTTEGNLPSKNTQIPVAASISPIADDDEYIIVRGVCECCHQESNIRIPKSLCK